MKLDRLFVFCVLIRSNLTCNIQIKSVTQLTRYRKFNITCFWGSVQTRCCCKRARSQGNKEINPTIYFHSELNQKIENTDFLISQKFLSFFLLTITRNKCLLLNWPIVYLCWIIFVSVQRELTKLHSDASPLDI